MARKLFSALLIVILLANALSALELTDDPATMGALSMFLAQWCKDQGLSYGEAFLWTLTLSVAKEIADQAADKGFNSGHIGLNLLSMSFSWFIFDF